MQRFSSHLPGDRRRALTFATSPRTGGVRLVGFLVLFWFFLLGSAGCNSDSIAGPVPPDATRTPLVLPSPTPVGADPAGAAPDRPPCRFSLENLARATVLRHIDIRLYRLDGDRSAFDSANRNGQAFVSGRIGEDEVNLSYRIGDVVWTMRLDR